MYMTTQKSSQLHQTVMKFIARFTNNGKRQEVIECFSCGCCYWFAETLYERFFMEVDECYLMYDPVINHWACKIEDRVYDITGDVTFDYKWKYWESFKYEDELLTARLFQDCINFGGPEDE